MPTPGVGAKSRSNIYHEHNVFGDEDKLLKNDPIEEELENIYSDQFQLQ